MKQIAPFTILYEDEYIVAINKASGIAVCADRWDPTAHRLDKLLAARNGKKVFIVHRIDRDTSGLVVFAKDEETHRKLSVAFETRQIKKRYIAAIHGRPHWKETVCDLPLVIDGNKQHLTIIDKYQGKESLTRFRLLATAGNYSIVEAIPETGRTHQIRVHLASLGHSVLCDGFYGNAKPVFLSAIKSKWRGDKQEERPLLSRLGLHASELVLPELALPKLVLPNEGTDNPVSLNKRVLNAPLPRDMAALVNQIEKCSASSFDIE
jgi:RluA family pseudouridine synthase